MKDECTICSHLNVWKCCPEMVKLITESSKITVNCKFFKAKKEKSVEPRDSNMEYLSSQTRRSNQNHYNGY